MSDGSEASSDGSRAGEARAAELPRGWDRKNYGDDEPAGTPPSEQSEAEAVLEPDEGRKSPEPAQLVLSESEDGTGEVESVVAEDPWPEWARSWPRI